MAHCVKVCVITSVQVDIGQYCHAKQTMWPINSGLFLPDLKFRLQGDVCDDSRPWTRKIWLPSYEGTYNKSKLQISDIQALQSFWWTLATSEWSPNWPPPAPETVSDLGASRSHEVIAGPVTTGSNPWMLERPLNPSVRRGKSSNFGGFR